MIQAMVTVTVSVAGAEGEALSDEGGEGSKVLSIQILDPHRRVAADGISWLRCGVDNKQCD